MHRACQIFVRVMLGLESSLLLLLDVADDDAALPRLALLPNTHHTLNHSRCHFAHTLHRPGAALPLPYQHINCYVAGHHREILVALRGAGQEAGFSKHSP